MILTLNTNVFVTSYLTDLNIPNGSSLTVSLMTRHLVNASGATVSPVNVLLPSQTHNGLSATTSADIAQIFCQFFSECFNDSDVLDTPPPKYNYSSFVSHCSSSSEDIHSFIRKLNNTSAAGVDGITRELRVLLAQSCLIFSILVSLLAAYLMPGSYLELFLFSSLANLTLPPLTDPSLFNPYAANFLKRKYMALSSNISTPTISSLTDNLDSCPIHLPPMLWPLPSMNGMTTWKDAKVLPWPPVFDLSKACDRVPHSPLVHKLRAVGVAGPLLSWFRSYY